MIRERSQNPLRNDGASDDERNVDEQLDEVMSQHDEATQKRSLENHGNNARIEPRRPSDPPQLPKRS